MRYWALAGILLVAFLVQSVLGSYLAIGGVAPNVLLGVVLAFGLLFGWQVGLGAGVIAGLLLDLVAARFVGIHLLSLGATGLVAGLVEDRVFKDNLVLPALAGLLGSLASQTLVLLSLWVLGWQISLVGSLRSTFLPAALYDVILCILIYGRIYKSYRYLRPDPRGTISIQRQ